MKLSNCLIAVFLSGCLGLELLPGSESRAPDTEDSASDVIDFGDLSVDPASVDFGEVAVGSSGSTSVVLGFEGDGGVNVSEVSLQGSDGAIIVENVTSLPAVVAAGQDLVVDLLFSPAAEQDYSSTLNLVTDHDEAGTLQVECIGSGYDDGSDTTNGGLSVSPASLDYATVDLGSEDSRSLTVSNIGSGQLLLSDFQLGDASLSYQVDFALPYVLQSGDSKEVTVTWTPSSEGRFESEVVVQAGSSNEHEQSVAITGTSENLCDVCAPLIEVNTGDTDDHAMAFFSLSFLGPDEQAATVTNSGDQPLTITNIYVNNDTLAPAGTFSVDWAGSTITLDPWEVHNIQVTYTATGTAIDLPYEVLDQNILHIISNASNDPDYTVLLSGTGL